MKYLNQKQIHYIIKKYNIIIIGSSNTEYKEIEKYYYFLKFYFTLLENKKYSNYKSLNKHVENLKLFLDDETKKENKIEKLIKEFDLKRFFINNRRYLGNKYSLTNFIKKHDPENYFNLYL